MAKYDRRLLVPYLEDLCSIELLLVKVSNEFTRARNRYWDYENCVKRDVPPQAPEEVSNDGTGLRLVGICLVILAVFLFFSESIVGMLLAVVIGFGCIFVFTEAGYANRDYDAYLDKQKNYENALQRYNARSEERANNKKLQAHWLNQMNLLQQRVQEVEKVRANIYDANVIPLPYRNVYAVHFLYEYFRSSTADDVDMILQTFVLEEIKSKLDTVIQQQTEIILNQRMMIANQQKMNVTLAKNHEQKMKQLANLNENAERRNQYLEMINANLQISNYFAYHDYITKR